MVQHLSGGNKRKLQLAIAILGNPKIILLDEPSSGMDPETRKFMWSKLVKLWDTGCSLLISTHVIEEAEALASRVGIMING